VSTRYGGHRPTAVAIHLALIYQIEEAGMNRATLPCLATLPVLR
jgi:hypothetical protein